MATHLYDLIKERMEERQLTSKMHLLFVIYVTKLER